MGSRSVFRRLSNGGRVSQKILKFESTRDETRRPNIFANHCISSAAVEPQVFVVVTLRANELLFEFDVIAASVCTVESQPKEEMRTRNMNIEWNWMVFQMRALQKPVMHLVSGEKLPRECIRHLHREMN